MHPDEFSPATIKFSEIDNSTSSVAAPPGRGQSNTRQECFTFWWRSGGSCIHAHHTHRHRQRADNVEKRGARSSRGTARRQARRRPAGEASECEGAEESVSFGMLEDRGRHASPSSNESASGWAGERITGTNVLLRAIVADDPARPQCSRASRCPFRWSASSPGFSDVRLHHRRCRAAIEALKIDAVVTDMPATESGLAVLRRAEISRTEPSLARVSRRDSVRELRSRRRGPVERRRRHRGRSVGADCCRSTTGVTDRSGVVSNPSERRKRYRSEDVTRERHDTGRGSRRDRLISTESPGPLL